MIRIAIWTLGADPDARAVGRAVAAMRLDVLLLADLPGGRGGVRRIASIGGLQVASRAGRGRAGSAVLVGPDARALSASSTTLGAPDRPREAAHAIVGVGGHTLQVVAFRLGVEPTMRSADAAAVAALVDTVDRPAMLGGDLGEGVGGPASATLLAGRVDAWATVGQGPGLTYPAIDPTARHDVLIVDQGLVPVTAQVPGHDLVGAAATHLPVLVEFEDAP